MTTPTDTSNPARPEHVVTTPEALEAAREAFARAPVLAVDTESNSFFAYRERTCLVQVSTEDADWVIDPFAVDLAPLGAVFADPAVEKIFHAAELDVVQLKRDFGFAVTNLFDTLIAAKAVGRRKVGYASLVEDVCGVKLAKDAQRSDWGKRPLSAQQLAYAFADTRWLLTVAARLKEEVRAKGALVEEEVAVDCARMALKEYRPREVDPEAFERHPSAKKMDPLARRVLRGLYLWREGRAQQLDKPLFRVVGDEALGEIAVRKPVDKAALGQIPGMSPVVVGRYGDALLEVVRASLDEGPLERPRRTWTGPDPAEEERFEALRRWRKAAADKRGVEVEVIAGNAALKAIAKGKPTSVDALEDIVELDGFRRRLYGAQLVETLAALP